MDIYYFSFNQKEFEVNNYASFLGYSLAVGSNCRLLPMHDLRGTEYTFPETLYVLPKYLRWLKRFIINIIFFK